MLLIGPSAKDALLRPRLNNFLVLSEKNWLLDRSLDYLPVLLVHVDNLVLWCFWCIFSGSLQHFCPVITMNYKKQKKLSLSIVNISENGSFKTASLLQGKLDRSLQKLNSFLSTPYMFSTIYKVPVNNFLMQST